MNTIIMGVPAKIAVLQKIRQEKDILFTPLSDKLTKEMKHNSWKGIGELAESLGIIRGKPWQYMRDTLWANWKKRSMAKLDTAISTSLNGTPESKFNAIDKLVLDIIGVEEMEYTVDESGESVCSNEVSRENDNGIESVEILPLDLVVPTQRCESKYMNKKKMNRLIAENVVQSKKGKLLDLQIEYLELRKYTMSLQALSFERRLKLPRSKYTESIPDSSTVSFEKNVPSSNGNDSTKDNHENHTNG